MEFGGAFAAESSRYPSLPGVTRAAPGSWQVGPEPVHERGTLAIGAFPVRFGLGKKLEIHGLVAVPLPIPYRAGLKFQFGELLAPSDRTRAAASFDLRLTGAGNPRAADELGYGKNFQGDVGLLASYFVGDSEGAHLELVGSFRGGRQFGEFEFPYLNYGSNLRLCDHFACLGVEYGHTQNLRFSYRDADFVALAFLFRPHAANRPKAPQ